MINAIRVKIYWRVALQMRYFKVQIVPLVLAIFQIVVSAPKDFIASWIHFVNLWSTGNEKQTNPWCTQLSTALNSSISWNNSKNIWWLFSWSCCFMRKRWHAGTTCLSQMSLPNFNVGLEEYSVALAFA